MIAPTDGMSAIPGRVPGHPGRGVPTEMGRRGRRPLQPQIHTQSVMPKQCRDTSPEVSPIPDRLPGHPGRGVPTGMGRRGRRPLRFEFHTSLDSIRRA